MAAALLVAGTAYAAQAADPSPAPWVARMREASSLGPLQPDPLLDAAARRHAEDLAARGAISHGGADGSTVLERWRAAGGTTIRIGEIVGAGGALPDVEGAWNGSPSHRAVVLDPVWTHVGWGSARREGAVVYVVLFTRRATRDLAIGWEGGELVVRGSFTPREADSPVLFNGIRRAEPEAWDPARRSFLFRIKRVDFVPYLRLGYSTESGVLVLTDAMTPREAPSKPPCP